MINLILSLFMAAAHAEDPNIDVSIYQASEPGKVVVMVTVDGCTTKFVTKLEDTKSAKAIETMAEKAMARANNGCTGN